MLLIGVGAGHRRRLDRGEPRLASVGKDESHNYVVDTTSPNC
jgi:hypothetical protein